MTPQLMSLSETLVAPSVASKVSKTLGLIHRWSLAGLVAVGVLQGAVLAPAYAANTHTPKIYTVTGGGNTSGDNTLATTAVLKSAEYIVFDEAGNLYFSEFSAKRVRKVDVTTKQITTVAGGSRNAVPNDGTSVAANSVTLQPFGLAMGENNELYIADHGSHAILRVDLANNLIYKVAGTINVSGSGGDNGYANQATLTNPTGLEYDRSNDLLYIVDWSNRVRKIEAGADGVNGTEKISTYVGNGSTANMSNANDIRINAQDGLLYIADTENHRIMRVNVDKSLTRVAGTGTGIAGYSGDGGQATAAQLGYPTTIAFGSDGSMYIADYSNNRVRKVSGGTITTVAGTGTSGYSGDNGAATSAQLKTPYGVTINSIDGNLFIGDSGNLRVRRVSLNPSKVEVMLESSNPTISDAEAVALKATVLAMDPWQPLSTLKGGVTFIEDAANTTFCDSVALTEVSLGDSYATCNLAQGTLSLGSHNLLADYSGDANYAKSTSAEITQTVATIVSSKSTITSSKNPSVELEAVKFTVTVSGTTVNSPPTGTVTFWKKNKTQEICSAVKVTRVSTSTATATCTVSNLPVGQTDISAVYSGSTLYKTSSTLMYQTVTVAPVSSQTTLTSSKNPSAQWELITFTAQIRVADGSSPVGKVTFWREGTALCTNVAVSAGSALCSTSVLPLGNSTIKAEYSGYANYMGSTSAAITQTVSTITSSQSIITSSNNPSAELEAVKFTVKVSGTTANGVPTGTVRFWMVDPMVPGVQKDLCTTVKVTQASTSTATATCTVSYLPIGVTPIFAGYNGSTLYNTSVAQLSQTVEVAPGTITTVAGNGGYEYSGDGGQAVEAELSFPSKVAFDAAGNLYISDSGNNRIRKVTPQGIISTFAGNGWPGLKGDGGRATEAELNYPRGVAFDAAGNLYIADTNNLRIRKVTPQGVISTVAGNGTENYSGDGGQATQAALNYPWGIVFDATGNWYIADTGNNVIRKVIPTGVISTVVGLGTPGPTGDGGQAINAQLYTPESVVFDATGNLYIADINNHRIRKVFY